MLVVIGRFLEKLIKKFNDCQLVLIELILIRLLERIIPCWEFFIQLYGMMV
jgi:hypothetical protein